MLQAPSVFSPATSYSALDFDEITKVLKGIWGKPVSINGVPTKDQHCTMVRHASGKVAYRNVIRKTDLIQMAKKSSVYRDQDLYIAKNTYINRTVRFDTTTLFGIRNICIDIDNHDPELSAADICNTANIFIQDLFESYMEYDIPLPNAAVYTGRGIQLWYFLDCVPKNLCFIASAISEKLCDLYEQFLQDSPITYDGFDIDRAASTRDSGLYRAPGSFNPSAKCFAQGKLWSSKRWDINELKDELGVEFREAVESTAHNMTPMPHNNITPKKCGNNHGAPLLSFLHELAESGNYESREVLCHIYHAMLLLYGTGETEASIKVHELNDVFTDPLREWELVALIKCNEKHRYKYRESTIFDRIGVPDDMIADYYAQKAARKAPRDYRQENSARDNQRHKNRIAWHNEIRALRNQGCSINEISRITGRAWKTVKKYADTPMEQVEGAALTEVDYNTAKKRAVRLYKRGFRSPEKIARILDVDNVTAMELLEDYKAYRIARSKKQSTMFLLRRDMKAIGSRINTLQQTKQACLNQKAKELLSTLYNQAESLLSELSKVYVTAHAIERLTRMETARHKLKKELRRIDNLYLSAVIAAVFNSAQLTLHYVQD